MIDFAAIKESHPLEQILEARYQVTLRKAPGGFTCCCPIHLEKSPSFQVNTIKQLFHCFGCAAGGSVLDLVMLMEGATNARSAAEILEGRTLGDEKFTPSQPKLPPVLTERMLPETPKMFRGEKRHLEQVAELRKLDWLALEAAQKYGCLRFCEAYDKPAYAIFDVQNPVNIQVRRYDGKLWFERSKVMGVKGNWATWPVGLNALNDMPWGAEVLLVEGTGDMLAAWEVVLYASKMMVPVAMFGASQSIHEGALPCFDGRNVIIIEQHDPAGAKATERWTQQLTDARAKVRVWKVPNEGRDLNDYVSAGGDTTLIWKP